MKRTFWTRNLFIGVLMGLVMLLGVQESADAISRLTRSSGDLQTVITDDEYQIRFTVSLQSPRRGSAYTSHVQTPSADVTDTAVADKRNKTTYYEDDYDPSTDPVTGERGYQNEDQVTYDTAHDYEQEQIAITVAGGGVIKKVGSYDVPANTTSLTMYESTHNSYSTTSNPHQRLSGSVALTLTAPDTAAPVTITIDPTTDGPTGHVEPPDLIFTVYVVPSLDTTTAVALAAATNEAWVIGNDNADRRIDDLFTPATGNAPVIYKVEGPGRLYVEFGNRKSRPLQTLSTSKAAPVYLDMNGGSNRVSIRGRDRSATESLLVIFNEAQIEIISGNDQTGVPDSRLRDPLGIRVKDAKGRPLSGLAVSFTPSTGNTLQPVIGTDVYLESDNTWADAFADIVRTKPATSAVPTRPITVSTAGWVPTNRSGEAQVYLKLSSTAGSQTVTVRAGNDPETFDLTSSVSTDIPSLEIISGNNQRSATNGRVTNPLVVRVTTSNNQPKPGQRVTFTTTKGYLTTLAAHQRTGEPATRNGPATQVDADTDVNGRAAVSYDLVEHSGASDVIAEISSDTVPTYQRRVTFNINGGSSTREPITREPAAPRNAVAISLSRSTGEPGDEITVSVTSDPTGQVVTINSGELDDDDFSSLSDFTPFRSTLTLPSEDGEYDFSASGPAGFTSDSATVTVETGILGRITISAIGQPSNGTQLFTITVRDTDGDRISSALTVTVSGSGFATTRVNTQDGIGDVRLTLPTTAQLYTLTASAEDYTPGTTQVRITASEPPQDTGAGEEEEVVEEEEEEAPEPASIEISGPPTRTGTANTAIEAALLVQVLDANDNAIEDARVIFRVRTGQGRLSQRGNGRAVAVQTDSRGYARTDYTPISASSTVEAEVRGVRNTVTFTISTGSVPPPRDTTPGTGKDTPSDTVSPTVYTPAAQRPPMLWVAGGKIYSLVGAEVQEFTPNLNNVMNIAIGGNKVYWTAKTSASSGTINAANLDGSGVKELKSIMAIPMGIAVDTPNSLLYWTNSRGRIQSANLDGSGIQNVMENLRNPNDLALAGGNVYWTESNHGSVRFVNLRGQKQVRVISTGDDPAGSLAIANGKVYWTEQVGESGGTINVANLNGSGATELASILATPIGIAVDTARSKLYWTNARGRVQSASLSGSSIRNVVGGLESPGEIVVSNSIKAPKATTAVKSTTTAAGKGKYDINGDGSVDDKDVDMLLLAVLSELTAAKYDVNGDGSVDVKDVREVNKNLDTGAAGAPALLGRKFSAVERDRLQDQIDLLVATHDRSPATLKTLIYLQQLLAMARPEKTQLLANYPNPFNPETWIPYELATDTNVKITIYTSTGVVVRALLLGHQPAGYYTDRERAAYWDGRNALGEQVASGIYFYHFETDEMSSMRKMVILK